MAGAVQRFIRRGLTENLHLKALALFITMLIFATVRGGRETTARITVDVEVIRPGDAAVRVLMTDVPESVKVRVRGSQRLVQIVSDEEIPTVTLDLRDAREGPYAIDRAPFRIPPGLEVVSVTPATVDLRFEDRLTRVVPVVPVLTGDVIASHHVKEPVPVDPETVTLTGPASEVSVFAEVRTAPILVKGLAAGQHVRRVRVEQAPRRSRFLEDDEVTVTVIVEPDEVERAFVGRPVEVRGTDMSATAETVTVIATGHPDAIASLSPDGIVAFVAIDEERTSPGAFRAEVQVEGVSAPVTVRAAPPTVIVQLVRTPPAPAGASGPPAAAPREPGRTP